MKIAELIRGASEDFFRCSWKKGHATDDIIAAGVLTQEEAARQANADSLGLATQGARPCDFDTVWSTVLTMLVLVSRGSEISEEESATKRNHRSQPAKNKKHTRRTTRRQSPTVL